MLKKVFLSFLALGVVVAKPQLGAVNLVPLRVNSVSATPVPVLPNLPQVGPGTSGLTTPLSAVDINNLSAYIVAESKLNAPNSLAGMVALITQVQAGKIFFTITSSTVQCNVFI